MKEYLAASRRLGLRLISIILSCSDGENERRLLSRAESSAQTTKLSDVQILRTIRAGEDVFEYGEDAWMEIKVDVTGITPGEVAESLAPRVRESLTGALCSSEP